MFRKISSHRIYYKDKIENTVVDCVIRIIETNLVQKHIHSSKKCLNIKMSLTYNI